MSTLAINASATEAVKANTTASTSTTATTASTTAAKAPVASTTATASTANTKTVDSNVANSKTFENGVAQMNLTIQNSDVTITLDGNYFSFLGFDHKPTTPKQKEAYEKLVNTFNKDINSVFSFDKQANCKNVSVSLKDNGMPTSNKSVNFHGEFKFTCENAQSLKDLQVNLFEHFNNLHTVNVQITANNTQKSEVLSVKNNSLKW